MGDPSGGSGVIEGRLAELGLTLPPPHKYPPDTCSGSSPAISW